MDFALDQVALYGFTNFIHGNAFSISNKSRFVTLWQEYFLAENERGPGGYKSVFTTPVLLPNLRAIAIFTEHGISSRTSTQRQQQPHQFQCRGETKG
jgi:hypothetical protein